MGLGSPVEEHMHAEENDPSWRGVETAVESNIYRWWENS